MKIWPSLSQNILYNKYKENSRIWQIRCQLLFITFLKNLLDTKNRTVNAESDGKRIALRPFPS